MNRRTFLAATTAAALAPWHARAQDKPKFRVVDTHLHLFDTTLQGKNGVPNYTPQDATLETYLKTMDRGGVAKAFLISYGAEDVATQIKQRNFDVEKLKPLINKAYMFEAFKKHPERFWWFPDHVDPSRNGFLDDMLKDFENGASGIKLLPIFHGALPDHPGFIKAFELCRKHRKSVILDSSWWYMQNYPLFNENGGRAKAPGSFAEYAKVMVPIFREFHDVPFSLAHAGALRAATEYKYAFPLIAAFPNVSCDVAAATGYSAAFIERLVRAVGAHKVMYGSDWPYWSTGVDSYLKGDRRWTMIVDECPSLTDDERQQILAGNAERFARFEMPDARKSRAEKLHRESTVIVVHDHNPVGTDTDQLFSGGVTAKLYKCGVDIDVGPEFMKSALLRDGWKAKTEAEIARARSAIESDPKRLTLALSADDIEQAKRDGKAAIVLAVEGGKLLEGDLANVNHFYDLGLRQLQLVWAVPNHIVERETLTEFGKSVVVEAQKLGMVVDLSHMQPKAFAQAVELATKPLIVSHGTAKEQGPERLAGIKRTGGVVAVHFFTSYLGPRPTNIDALDAIDDLVQQAGVESAALGIDLFPTNDIWQAFLHAQGTKDVTWAIPDLGHLPEMTRGLVARGYKDDDIRAILGGNYLRVLRECMKT